MSIPMRARIVASEVRRTGPSASRSAASSALRGSAAVLSAALAALASLPAAAQSEGPAVFVANNGNLEGSVTSLTVAPDGSLAFRQKLVLGSVPSSSIHHPGLNAAAISISPNGRWLAVSHATSSDALEQISILEVLPDAGIELAFTFLTPDSPLDVEWITDSLLAVTKTMISGVNEVRIHRLDPEAHLVSFASSAASGGFNSWIAVHPSRTMLFTQESSGNTIRTFGVDDRGMLKLLATASNGAAYPLGLGISPDGTRIYSGGGISAGGRIVSGHAIDPATGVLTPIPGSPWTSPGQSPKQVVVSGDGAFAYVAHGTDSTIRGFAIGEGGGLSDIGVMFDVGVQGSLGEIAAAGNLLFATDRDTILDGQRGVYSFTIAPDGSLVQNGPLVDTQGIGPGSIAVWIPAKRPANPADLDGSGEVDGADLAILLGAWGECPGCAADIDGDDVVGGSDLAILLGAWG